MKRGEKEKETFRGHYKSRTIITSDGHQSESGIVIYNIGLRSIATWLFHRSVCLVCFCNVRCALQSRVIFIGEKQTMDEEKENVGDTLSYRVTWNRRFTRLEVRELLKRAELFISKVVYTVSKVFEDT